MTSKKSPCPRLGFAALGYLRRPSSLLLLLAVLLAAGFTFFLLLSLVFYILSRGLPHLTPSLFSLAYTSENVSLFPAAVGTLLITALSLLLSVPLGIFSAIYLAEYARKGSKAVALIRTTAETLSGIPSIVYGLFGTLFFVTALRWGYSILAGACTLGIMILPLVMRTTEEALLSVPDSYREASFGLGAGRLGTVFRVVLPAAAPGILSGIILSIGRIVGETAALLYTAGSVAKIPANVPGEGPFSFLFQSGRTLAVHMYALSSEGLHTDEAYATAVVLLALVLLLNGLSTWAAKRLGGVSSKKERAHE